MSVTINTSKGKPKEFKLFDESDIQYLRENYPIMGARNIAPILGVKWRYVEHVAQDIGLKMTPEARRQIVIKALEKPPEAFKVNHTKFTNVETPEVAYFLGFLWADGNLDTRKDARNVRISINTSDVVNLLKISSQIGDFCVNHSNYSYRNNRTCISTNNKYLYAFLEENDYSAKSCSSACKILNHIPDHLKHYWFRGLSDGDGCFSYNKTSRYFAVSSAVCQDWKYMIQVLSNLKIVGYSISIIKDEKGSSSQIRIHNPDDILIFGKYIYEGYPSDGIGLHRKWEKFQQIVNYADNRKFKKTRKNG